MDCHPPSCGGQDLGTRPAPRCRADCGVSHSCDTLKASSPQQTQGTPPGPGAPDRDKGAEWGIQESQESQLLPAGRGLAAGLVETELFFEARQPSKPNSPHLRPPPSGKDPTAHQPSWSKEEAWDPFRIVCVTKPPISELHIFPLTSPSTV